MAHIHIPYAYTNYPESKLATSVDKFCHKPSRVMDLFMAGFLYGFYVTCCYSTFNPQVMDGGSVVILPLLLGAFGLFIGVSLKSACDNGGLSMNIARWDVKRKQEDLGYPVWFKLVIAGLILALILPGAAVLINSARETTAYNAYNEIMSPLSGSEEIAVTGDKITACETASYGDGDYSDYGIPEELLAQSPGEARFILRCRHSEEITGYYSESTFYDASAPKAFKRSVSVQLYDRSRDAIIASAVFDGGEPPRSTSSNTDQYGSMPSEDSIRRWVADVYEGAVAEAAPGVDAVASLNTESGMFSSYGVPNALRTQDPASARYILRCTHGEKTAYRMGTVGVSLPYTRYTCDVEIVENGSDVVLAAESFEGAMPAGNAVNGSRPSESEIIAWVEAVYPTLPDLIEAGGITVDTADASETGSSTEGDTAQSSADSPNPFTEKKSPSSIGKQTAPRK